MLVGIFSSPDKKNLARKSPWSSRFPHPVSLALITRDNVIYSVIRFLGCVPTRQPHRGRDLRLLRALPAPEPVPSQQPRSE